MIAFGAVLLVLIKGIFLMFILSYSARPTVYYLGRSQRIKAQRSALTSAAIESVAAEAGTVPRENRHTVAMSSAAELAVRITNFA